MDRHSPIGKLIMDIEARKFDTNIGTFRSPKWGVFLPDGRQGFDGPNVLAWRRKKHAQQWITIATQNPDAMSSQVNWRVKQCGICGSTSLHDSSVSVIHQCVVSCLDCKARWWEKWYTPKDWEDSVNIVDGVDWRTK